MRRWLADDMLPEPYLIECTRSHKVYSAGELEVIRRLLAEHQQEFAYLTRNHTEAIHRIHQAVQAYRMHHI